MVSLILLIAMGILCAYIHKNKGYLPVAGFCWGFFFFIIGLIIGLVERNREEQMAVDKGKLSMTQWLFILFFVALVVTFITGVIIGLSNWDYVVSNTCFPFALSLLVNNECIRD